MLTPKIAEIYTDGSCHTQLQIGGWAAIVFVNDERFFLSGKENNTTHQRMELVAIIKALELVQQKFAVIKTVSVFSDSQYAIGLIRREEKLKQQNFCTKSGKTINNADLVKQFLVLTNSLTVEFTKIKAHQRSNEIHVLHNQEVDKFSRSIVRNAVSEMK